MGKKILRLFLDTMLRAIVVILAIGIIIMGALLAKTMSKNKELVASKEETVSDTISTEEYDADDLTFTSSDSSSDDSVASDDVTGVSSTDAAVLVINAAGVSGVAGAWKTYLEEQGYASVEVGSSAVGSTSTTKVCVSGDYDGADLAELFTDPTMSTVDSLTSSDFDVSIDGYDIIVVVGTSDIRS